MDNYFDNGKSYIVGHNTNWHLYVAGDLSVPFHDSTLEIIMTKLSLGASKKFYTTRLPGDVASDDDHDLGHESGQEVLHATGLNSLFKYNKGQSASKETHDGFAFTPCGFSSNSMNDDGFTILFMLLLNQVGAMLPLKPTCLVVIIRKSLINVSMFLNQVNLWLLFDQF